MASTALSIVPYPVSTMTAVPMPRSCSARRSPMPSRTGIFKSVRMTSNDSLASTPSAASPLAAWLTVWPARSRFFASVRAMFTSSSTRRMRVVVGDAHRHVVELGRDRHAARLEVLAEELERAADQVVHVETLEVAARLARELEQVLDDRLGPADLLFGDAKPLVHLAVGG